MKKLLSLIPLVMIARITIGGIYRHDVPEQKYKDLAAEKQFDCVGLVLSANHDPKGCCVLIGKRHVLSAAHVFVEYPKGNDTIYLDGQGHKTQKLVAGGQTMIVNQACGRRVGDPGAYFFRFNGTVYRAKSIKLYPSYLDSVEKSNGCRTPGDLALIELEDTVANIQPAIVNITGNELNAVVTGVGYGVSGIADKPEFVGPHMEKIAGQNVIDKISDYLVNGQPTMMSSDFDHPTRSDCNKMGSAVPMPLEYLCGGGDSGGGVFTQKGGRWMLAGIITGGPDSGISIDQLVKTGYYGQVMQSLRLSVFYKWIEQSIKSNARGR